MMVMTFVLVILPLMTTAIRYHVLRIRQQQAADILSASLPAAYLAVSADDLSEGRLTLDEELASDLIASTTSKNAALSGIDWTLASLRVAFARVSRPEDPGHWLSGNRPDEMPVVGSVAGWLFPDGVELISRDQIELVLD